MSHSISDMPIQSCRGAYDMRLVFWRPEPKPSPSVKAVFHADIWKDFYAKTAALITELVTPSREPGAVLGLAQFVVAIGQHLVSAHDGPLPDAPEMARQCLRDFLRDERIKYGDPRYAWDYAAAGVVARCYQIEFWDKD